MAARSLFKIICIGDPHFKDNNKIETDLMLSQVRELIVREQPDFVVILGDLLHRFEKLDMQPLKRATEFLQMIKAVSPHMFVIIGNHDRPNNNDFLTDNHAFAGLNEWSKTTVVDVVKTHSFVGRDGLNYKFVFVPYVHAGRLQEALATKDLKAPYADISVFFAHQEFKGAKMNAITSNEGDVWDRNWPLCVSGHIHDFDELQLNLFYPGTPIQHGFADTKDKTISILHLDSLLPLHPHVEVKAEVKEKKQEKDGVLKLVRHQRVSLKIPRKFVLNMSPEELTKFVLPPDTHVKIKVNSSKAAFDEVMKFDNVIRLCNTPTVKIVHVDTTPFRSALISIPIAMPKTRLSYSQRLRTDINKQDPETQQIFGHLFGILPMHM